MAKTTDEDKVAAECAAYITAAMMGPWAAKAAEEFHQDPEAAALWLVARPSPEGEERARPELPQWQALAGQSTVAAAQMFGQMLPLIRAALAKR